MQHPCKALTDWFRVRVCVEPLPGPCTSHTHPSLRAVAVLPLWSVFQHSEPPGQMTYLSSPAFPLVRWAGVGQQGWGDGPQPWCWEENLAPSCCCLGRDLRLIEVTETICKRLLDYSLHKERTGSNRFAKVGFVLVSCSLWGQALLGLSVSAGMCVTVRARDLPSFPPLSSWVAVCIPC